MSRLGVVTIGRNEGQRLVRCLESLIAHTPDDTPIVYVDSGSADDSVKNARRLGVTVVELDMSQPFTMARGRNTGLDHLTRQHPQLEYVQFIDGDCELVAGWIDAALAAIEPQQRLALVCGRRRERFPDASLYNRLTDIEWNTPVGEAVECGGDMLARLEAIRCVNAYDPTLICGEEPEMCVRLRQAGWTIKRIDSEMTIHDAAMMRFGQWWRRSIRGGWAYAQGAHLHGQPPERHKVRETRSVWWWGLIFPTLVLFASGFFSPWCLLLLLAYDLMAVRIWIARRRSGDSFANALLYACFCVLAKFPQAIGQIRYRLHRLRGGPAQLIEYKNANTNSTAVK